MFPLELLIRTPMPLPWLALAALVPMKMPVWLPRPEEPTTRSAMVSLLDWMWMPALPKSSTVSPLIVLPFEPAPRTKPSWESPAPSITMPGSVVPSMITLFVMAGSGRAAVGLMTRGPLGMANVMVLPDARLAFTIAWASEPGQMGLVLMTVNRFSMVKEVENGEVPVAATVAVAIITEPLVSEPAGMTTEERPALVVIVPDPRNVRWPDPEETT